MYNCLGLFLDLMLLFPSLLRRHSAARMDGRFSIDLSRAGQISQRKGMGLDDAL